MESNPFQASEAQPSRDAMFGITNDGWLTIAMALLIVPASLCGMLVLITGAVGVMGLLVDIPTEPGDPPIWIIGFVECAIFLVPTVLYGAAAVGVFQRAKWGWVMALIGFALWMSGCCMPLGLAGFYALLREDGRRAFGFETG